MSHPNVYKAPGQSQLRKTDTSTLEQNGPTRTRPVGRPHTAHPTERCHKGANGNWAARTCIRHLGGHNLAKLIWAPSNETA